MFMCNANVLDFFLEYDRKNVFKGKRVVLEISSKYVNGSIRPLIDSVFCLKNYFGADTEPDKYVDVILGAENLVKRQLRTRAASCGVIRSKIDGYALPCISTRLLAIWGR